MEAGLHLLTLLAHAAAVVDDDAERYGNIFALEQFDGLLDAVFVDLERFLLQIGD